jgi:predicted metal-dependent hydrolase
MKKLQEALKKYTIIVKGDYLNTELAEKEFLEAIEYIIDKKISNALHERDFWTRLK